MTKPRGPRMDLVGMKMHFTVNSAVPAALHTWFFVGRTKHFGHYPPKGNKR